MALNFNIPESQNIQKGSKDKVRNDSQKNRSSGKSSVFNEKAVNNPVPGKGGKK